MTDPRDELVERVAQIVYEAMRFDRENYTPPWQNGNSLAEDEARATAARLRAEVAWHVADKNKWQDTQAAHLREVTRLTARVEELEATLSWIDQQRYTDRDTINPDNAFEKIGKLNGKIIAIMDRARAAITQEGE